MGGARRTSIFYGVCKAFDLDFETTAEWDGDLLIEEFALWDSAMQGQPIGLA